MQLDPRPGVAPVSAVVRSLPEVRGKDPTGFPRACQAAPGIVMIELRTYVYIDSLQPQLAEYMATVSQGFPPVPGDACLWVEVSPGMAIHRLTNIALKATRVHLTQQVVERAFGSMVIHHRDQSDVREAGHAILANLGATHGQPCKVAWQEVIRGMSSDHTVVINRQNRHGSMILPDQSMFIL